MRTYVLGTLVDMARERGKLVRASCACTHWWLEPVEVGEACDYCGESMREEMP